MSSTVHPGPAPAVPRPPRGPHPSAGPGSSPAAAAPVRTAGDDPLGLREPVPAVVTDPAAPSAVGDVLAVVLAPPGPGGLPVATLAGLRAQTRPPDGAAVVATGGSSLDAAARAAAVRAGAALLGTRSSVGADAVRAALLAADDARLAPRAPAPHGAPAAPRGVAATPGLAPRSWVWVLPAGAVPAPDALARLLAAVEVAPSVAVAGPKLRDPGGHLVQAGLRTSRAGRPLPGVTPGEPDQGQLDHRDDVLAVAVTGLLVRRDVWDALGGPGEGLRDGGGDGAAVDLCRRAWLAGHRVVVVPAAVVTLPDGVPAGVPDAVRDGTRPASARPTAARRGAPGLRRARHDRALLRLADCPLPLLPVVAAMLMAGALARAGARVVAGSPGAASAEVTGVVAALGRPLALARARRSRSRTRTLPRRALRPLTASRPEVLGWHRERLDRLRTGAAGRRSATSTLESRVDGGPDVGAPAATPGRGPLVLVLAALTGASVLLLRPLWSAVARGEAVELGAQAAVPSSAAALWQAATSGWLPSGLGRPGVPDPLLAALAGLSVPLGGSPPAAVAVLLLGALPLAALSAWWAAGALTRRVPARLGAALVWALAVPLPAAVATGRTGTVLAHLALPLAVRGLVSTVRPGVSPAAARAGAASLAVAAVSAGAPVLLPVLAVVAVGLALGGGSTVTSPGRPADRPAGRGAPVGRRLLVAAVPLPAAAMLLPLWAGLPAAPRVLLAEPGVLPATGPGPSGGAQDLAWLALAGLGAAALVGLARGGRAGAVAGHAWLLTLAGALAAVAVAVLGGTGPVGPAAASASASVVLLGLVVAALAAVASPRPAGPGRRWARAAAAVLVPAALAAPAAGAWAWTAATLEAGRAGEAGPVARAPLPGVAADAAASPSRARTLVLSTAPTTATGGGADGGQGPVPDVGTGVRWALADTARPAATAASAWARLVPLPGTSAVDPADDAVARTVAALASGRADPRPALADLGVGHVLLRPAAAASAVTPAVLDAVPGLTRAASTEAGDLWRVEPVDPAVPASRVRVLDGGGGADTGGSGRGTERAVPAASPAGAPLAVDTPLPPGEPGRVLVLAERADAGWTATLDGAPLDPAVHAGWAQAFRLPAAGGRLVVAHGDRGAGEQLARWLPLGLAAVAAAPLLLHLGSRRREGGS